jgi:hypothetical protein
MKPSIQLHGVARINLGPISTFPRDEENDSFATRRLTVTDSDGDSFVINIFGQTADHISLPDELAVAKGE